MFTIDQVFVQLLIGALLPVAIGFFLRDDNPQWVKVVFGTAATVAATLIAQTVQDTGNAVISKEMVIAFFLTWVPSGGR